MLFNSQIERLKEEVKTLYHVSLRVHYFIGRKGVQQVKLHTSEVVEKSLTIVIGMQGVGSGLSFSIFQIIDVSNKVEQLNMVSNNRVFDN